MYWVFSFSVVLLLVGISVALAGDQTAGLVLCGSGVALVLIWILVQVETEIDHPKPTNPRWILKKTMKAEDREWDTMQRRRIERRRARRDAKRRSPEEPPSHPARRRRDGRGS